MSCRSFFQHNPPVIIAGVVFALALAACCPYPHYEREAPVFEGTITRQGAAAPNVRVTLSTSLMTPPGCANFKGRDPHRRKRQISSRPAAVLFKPGLASATDAMLGHCASSLPTVWKRFGMVMVTGVDQDSNCSNVRSVKLDRQVKSCLSAIYRLAPVRQTAVEFNPFPLPHTPKRAKRCPSQPDEHCRSPALHRTACGCKCCDSS